MGYDSLGSYYYTVYGSGNALESYIKGEIMKNNWRGLVSSEIKNWRNTFDLDRFKPYLNVQCPFCGKESLKRYYYRNKKLESLKMFTSQQHRYYFTENVLRAFHSDFQCSKKKLHYVEKYRILNLFD